MFGAVSAPNAQQPTTNAHQLQIISIWLRRAFAYDILVRRPDTHPEFIVENEPPPANSEAPWRDIFRVVADVLAPAGIDCLLVGGFAVNHHGYTRSTLDIDLMIVAERRDDVQEIMKREGFTNIAVQANVTFFNRPGTSLRIDFLSTDRTTMAKMLENASWAEFHGKKVRVPALPHLLAMKFFALSQAWKKRVDKDVPDIAWLTVLNRLDVESDLHPLALRFADDEIFRRVLAKIEEIGT